MTSQKTNKKIEHGVVWATHFHNDKRSPLQSWCPNMTTWVTKCDKTLSEVRATRLTPINPTCCNWFQAEPPCDIDNNVESDDANTYPMIWDYCHAKLQQADIWNFGSLKHGEREKMQNGHCFLLGFHGGSGLTHPEKNTKLGDPQLLIQPDPVTAPLAPRLWESTGLYSYIHIYIYITCEAPLVSLWFICYNIIVYPHY